MRATRDCGMNDLTTTLTSVKKFEDMKGNLLNGELLSEQTTQRIINCPNVKTEFSSDVAFSNPLTGWYYVTCAWWRKSDSTTDHMTGFKEGSTLRLKAGYKIWPKKNDNDDKDDTVDYGHMTTYTDYNIVENAAIALTAGAAAYTAGSLLF